MKFIVSSTSLSSHLQSISRVISNKNTLPILDNFLFKIDGNKLDVTASDLETTLTTSLEVDQPSGNGSVAISAKLLLDILKEFSEQPLEFNINDENLSVIVTSGSGTYKFIGQSGDEYPSVPNLAEEKNTIKLPTEILFGGIDKTIFATASEELRPTMTGIFFDITDNDITFVATDAHKLVRLKNKTVSGIAKASFILPQKPAAILKTILPKETGQVEIIFDEKNIAFSLSKYKMICRQIEGKFPNYEGVIPKNNPNKIVIDRLSLLNSVKRVSVFTNQGNNLIKLSFSSNELTISAQDIDFAISAEEKIACQYSDEPINIGFKSQFLLEILNNISASNIIIALSDPSRAGLLLPLENQENEDLLMLLMPMLLND